MLEAACQTWQFSIKFGTTIPECGWVVNGGILVIYLHKISATAYSILQL